MANDITATLYSLKNITPTQAENSEELGFIRVVGNGLSAYEVAVENGFSGTEAQWLASLKGPKGDDGNQGLRGPQG